MSVTDHVYDFALSNVGIPDLVAGPLFVSLHGTAYVPDRGADQTYADLAGEISGTGYTAGGAQVATADVSIAVDGTAHTLAFKIAGATSWGSATFGGVRTAVLRLKAGTAPAAQYLVAYRTLSDDEADRSVDGADFRIPWSSEGVFLVRVP
jgi:hypothetical protein